MGSRQLPLDGRPPHELIRGITRGNQYFVLVNVSGHAYNAFRIVNGIGAPRDFSGHASLSAEYSVEDWGEDAHPMFDSIKFEIPQLNEILDRSGQWMPFRQLSGVPGYVGTVTPRVARLKVPLPGGGQVIVEQEIRNGSYEVPVVEVRACGRSTAG